jgi:hypothetical protein
VFACEHTDARNLVVNIMVEQNPTGERTRFSDFRTASRH